MEAFDASGTTGLIDFMDETNFEQFIELIRGESADPIVKLCPNSNYDCEHINGCLDDNLQFGSVPEELFDFNATTNMSYMTSILNSNPGELELERMEEEEEEENDGEEESSATTTMIPTMRGKKKTDRSRTLVSERRRRGRMKEKLYALRSLVPNITKMDKASIVGDAVLYVQQLQIQVKKLKAEIAGLLQSSSSSLTTVDDQNATKIQALNTNPICNKKIVMMEVFQVEERGFYVRLLCNKGQGVAASLYKALDSLISSFNVQSSNLATASQNFILTFTLNVRESEVNINLPNLKLWVAGALLNQGFEFKTSPAA